MQSRGLLFPLKNLIDKYMPNLQAVFEKYPEYRTMCTAPDGHIYSFPWIEQLGAGKEAIQAIGDIAYINKNGWIILDWKYLQQRMNWNRY